MSAAADTTSTSAVMAQLGKSVRRLRTASRLTMEQLAEASGVSRRVISQLERGISNPSLATIDRIAGSLGTDFASLMLPTRQESLVVSAPIDGGEAWSTAKGSIAALRQSTTQTPPAELWEWVLAPGDEYIAEPDPDGSVELFLTVAGTLTIDVAGEGAKTVPAGQSARLASDRSYSYRNDGSVPVRFVRVVQLADV